MGKARAALVVTVARVALVVLVEKVRLTEVTVVTAEMLVLVAMVP